MGNSASLSSVIAAATDNTDHVSRKVTERGKCNTMGIAFAVSGMKGLRPTMEDKHIFHIGIPVGQKAAEAAKAVAAANKQKSLIVSPASSCSPTHSQTETAATTLVGHTILEDHAVFGIFDGHGGDFTSNYLAEHFMTVFASQSELKAYSQLQKTGSRGQSDVNAIILLRKAITKTFVQLDKKLLPLHEERTEAILSGKLQPPPIAPDHDMAQLGAAAGNAAMDRTAKLGERSGSTAVVVILTPSHIVCANCGDSRAVLRRFGTTLPLSFDHKPTDLPERLRIEATKAGFVKGRRVNGDLAVSRSFGDFSFKKKQENRQKEQYGDLQQSSPAATKQEQRDQNGKQQKRKQQGRSTSSSVVSAASGKTSAVHELQVTVVPDIMVYPRYSKGDEFMILACDGVWDVASNKQCTDFVQVLLSEGEVDLGNICEEILDTCLDRNSRDNMTIMLVGLPALELETSQSALVNNVLWGHKASRLTRQMTQDTISVTNYVCEPLGVKDVCQKMGSSCMLAERPVLA